MKEQEPRIVHVYLRRILEGCSKDRQLFGALSSWVWEHAEQIGLCIEEDQKYDLLSKFPKAVEKREVTRQMLLDVQNLMLGLLDTAVSFDSGEETELENLSLLSQTFKLEHEDLMVLEVFYHYSVDDTFETFADVVSKTYPQVQDALVALTGLSRKEITKRLSIEGRLLQTGLLKSNGGCSGYLSNSFKVPTPVQRGLRDMKFNRENFKELFLGKASRATLAWNDYEHLGETRSRIAGFLKKAVKNKESGINILLWGAPGTGKTEFTKTLAQQIGIDLFSVGECDQNGEEPTRDDRLSALLLSQNLLRDQDGTLLLFDEIDDLLQPKESGRDFFGQRTTTKRISKLFMNRLFEKNPVPTIWTLNDIDLLDPAILRRMSLAIHFEKPPRKSREKILQRILKEHSLRLNPDALASVLEANVTPAVLSNAVRFSKISRQGEKGVKFALEGLATALGTEIEPSTKRLDRYNASLINSDLDLGCLADRLCQQNSRSFSLCLYGPPGTGKSEFVSYLADRLKMEPQVVRTSDLLGPFVGETERAIARAFRSAREQETFLIFDEADSILSDRRGARQSWEVSRVNEMLTWMESHPLPFACTTNLKERLDPASLRRFTFKGEFHFLLPAQAARAFVHFFGCKAPEEVKEMGTLTPGDFAVVARKAKLLDVMDQPAELLEMLVSECLVKEETPSRIIGFRPSAH